MIDAVIFVGDAIDSLRKLPPASIHCCVTSPPYFGLRDYGVAGQIGLEPTPEEYVARLVAVFTEVKRVLRDDGTLWVNLGDSYAANASGPLVSGGFDARRGSNTPTLQQAYQGRVTYRGGGVKGKDLIGVPWTLALALRADGWYLRDEIIWHKPNPMPSSVTDRTTRAHEQIFMLSKSSRYYYDAAAIAEPSVESTRPQSEKRRQMRMNRGVTVASGLGQTSKGVDGGTEPTHIMRSNPNGTRNCRSVWTITNKPFSGAHFAVFPPELPARCLAAGSPVGGIVLDPFAGASTTGLVAIAAGRRFIGCELNPEYAEISRKRLGPERVRIITPEPAAVDPSMWSV